MKNKIWLFGFVMLLLVGSASAWTAGTIMYPDMACAIPKWVSNTALGSNNHGNVSIKFSPICCGMQWAPLNWHDFNGLHMANLPRCDLVEIRVINYFGTTNAQDSGWVSLDEYYLTSYTGIYTDQEFVYEVAVHPDGDSSSTILASLDVMMDGNHIPTSWQYWGAGVTIFNVSGSQYNATLNLNKTGANTVKVMVRAGEPQCDMYRSMTIAAITTGFEDTECLNPTRNASVSGLGYDGGYYTTLINFSVVDSGGNDPGEGSSTLASTFIPPTSFFIDFEYPEYVWWILTVVAVGAVFVMGGLTGFSSKNSKMLIIFAAFVAMLMIFVGGYLGAISWIYFVVLGLIGVTMFVFYLRRVVT
jgi:hypothetical protein